MDNKVMNENSKQQIKSLCIEYVARYESQNQAANSLKGVSAATLSNVINDKHDKIKDTMWRTIGSQVGWKEFDWVSVETRDYKRIKKILTDAQNSSQAFAFIGGAGTGKSFTVKNFAKETPRAYVLSCNEYWNKKDFLFELLTAMGRDASGLSIAEMMREVVKQLKSQANPLIILDEADKLADQVLYFFITLFNQLENHCGFVLCATDHLRKRIKRGLNLNRRGYKEVYSRLGRKFIELKGVGITDVTQVCRANGINKPALIKDVWDDCEQDLRRVRRKVYALQMKRNEETQPLKEVVNA